MNPIEMLIEDCYKNDIPCVFEAATYADLEELNELLDKMLVCKEDLESIPELEDSYFMQHYEKLTALVENLLSESYEQQKNRNKME